MINFVQSARLTVRGYSRGFILGNGDSSGVMDGGGTAGGSNSFSTNGGGFGIKLCLQW